MNKQEAERLIKETFQNPFDEARFRLFIRNLINGEEIGVVEGKR